VIQRALRFALAAALMTCLAIPAAASRYILNLAPHADSARVMANYGLVMLRPLDRPGGSVYLVSGPDQAPASLMAAVAADPSVRSFESEQGINSPEVLAAAPPVSGPNALADAMRNLAPTQYYGVTVRGAYVQQWATALIHLPDVVGHYASGSGIVAVIDTGVDPNHPALAGVLVPGYDFTRDQPGMASEMADLDQSTVAILAQSTVAILDGQQYAVALNQSTVAILDQSTVAILDATKVPSDFGHGTMVSGLIHLVAPTAQIMPLKAFRADGSANLSDLVRAVYYAVQNGAKVINMSFSSPAESPSLAAAVLYAWKHNVICIASGGNDGSETVVYPAASAGVIGVGSTSAQDRLSAFSNYHTPSVEMLAPGEGLITLYPGNHYAGVWGTSFSAALTSGAAALMMDVNSSIGPSLFDSAVDQGPRLRIEGTGDVRLDIMAAIQYLLSPRDDE
jgi:subtilisin family serine protease